MKRLFIILTMILVAGCASSGTKVTDQQAQKYVNGVTTKDQIISDLGKPDSMTKLADGTSSISYMHVSASANAVNFVPVVGLLAGGAKSTTDTVTFNFDTQLKLVSYTSTTGSQDVSTGLLNQK